MRDVELYAKTLQIEHLKAQLAVLRRARFGRSSEKLDREIEQLELILGELEEGVAESNACAEQAGRTTRDGGARQAEQPQGERPQAAAGASAARADHARTGAGLHLLGGTVLRKIGEDVTEVLEYVLSSSR